MGAPESVRLVSASDKLHNARAILADLRVLGDVLWRRFNGGKEGTLWYYRSLVGAFNIAGYSPASEKFDRSKAVVEELDRVVTKIELLASMELLPTLVQCPCAMMHLPYSEPSTQRYV